jgi:hypothetical protein
VDGVLVLHWDGAAWSSVSTPSPGPYGGSLDDVAAIAPNDVWAVGYKGTGPGENEWATLTEHWDGTAWTIVPSPSAFSNSYFRGVSADSPSDVWAMGLPEVDRWDGSAWTLVSSVPPLTWRRAFFDIAAYGPDDVWVAGEILSPTQPAFSHWSGAAWDSTTGPPISGWGQIFGLGGPSSDSLWAVGARSTGALMERWDGTSWQVVPVNPGEFPAELWDVVVDSGGVGWAVGSTSNGQPLVVHTCRP